MTGSSLSPAMQELAERRSALLAGDGCGREFETSHARLFDDYFQARLREEASGLPPAPFLLLALGGYGRGRLSPGSDLDLTFVFPGEPPEQAENLPRLLLYPLWDAGLSLDYSIRPLAETMALAREEPKVMAGLLDARPVAGPGHEPLWRDYCAALADLSRGPARPAFLDWLRRLDEPKAQERGEGASLLEPNLKEGPGGLRDWQQIGWLARLFPGREGATLFELGLLESAELFALLEAHEQLARTRCALHRVAGRRLDVFHFELQPQVSGVLGLGAGPEDAARLLASLQPAMARVRLAREAMDREVNGRLGRTPRLAGLPDGLSDTPGGLGFTRDPAHEPMIVLALFETAASTGRMPSFSAMSALRRAAPAVGEAFSASPGFFHWLPRFLAQPHAREAARIFLELGLLGAIVPEIGRVQHMVQRDGFHRFPVGRHSLRTARHLAWVDEKAPALLCRCLEAAEDREVLVWAGLLHDAGKGGARHEEVGEGLSRAVLSRLGVSSRRVEEAAFLARRHLVLMDAATRRDLADVATAAHVASLVETPARLTHLTALSLADALSTGPMAYNGWKATLLSELYAKTAKYLQKGSLGEPLAGRLIMERRARVRALAAQEHSPDLVETFLEALPPDCLARLEPEIVTDHLNLFARYKLALAEDLRQRPSATAGKGLTVHEAKPLAGQDVWSFAVMAPDQPRLFATLAGCLSLYGGDIYAADIFTLTDGTALDVFVVRPPEGREDDPEFFEDVAKAVRWAGTGKLGLQERLAERRASPLYRPPRGSGREPSVRLANDLSEFFTVVEVAADDRLGRLYDIADVLAEAGLSVHAAKITTLGGQILDVFWVRGPGGQKVEAEARREDLRVRLTERLSASS